MARKKEISLLPDKDNPNSVIGRILVWVSSVGRYVVVFTELIIIGIFFSRFSLDRANSDISEKVRQKRAMLNSTTEFEKDYGILQSKIQAIKKFYLQDNDYGNKVVYLADRTPSDIVYENLSLKKTDGKLSANLSLVAYNESSLIDFITNLSLDNQNNPISSIDIKSIEKKSKENKYNVNLQLDFKNSSENVDQK
jgi:ACT domain-containing protein